MFRPATLFLLSAAAALAQVDQQRAAGWFKEIAVVCEREGGRLWGVSLCGPLAVVEGEAVIGPRSRVGALCFVGARAVLGEDVRLFPRAVVREGVCIGARVIVHSGAVLGADGFGGLRRLVEHLVCAAHVHLSTNV